MDKLRGLRASAWVLYGIALTAAGVDSASWLFLDEGGFPNALLMVGALAGGNASWHAADLLARHAAELTALREQSKGAAR